MAGLHSRGDLFPGDVLIVLAADALAESGASRDRPLDGSMLYERFLAEYPFSGRTARAKSSYALRATAMIQAGVEPDLVDDAGWYKADDFWLFALYALVAYVRAAADRTHRSTAAVCAAIGVRYGITVPVG